MNILTEIIAKKKKEVELLKSKITFAELEKYPFFDRNTCSLSASFSKNQFGIIAEFKRKSPSAGFITDKEPLEVTKRYQDLGANAVSILTDKDFFGGTCLDILSVRNEVHIPILRKEFIIDEFQIIQSKAVGADAILLIASILTKEQITHFTILAQSLGLEVLLELHNPSELGKVFSEVNCIGVNNRDLKKQQTSLQHSIDLFPFLPNQLVKISESGIQSRSDLAILKEIGYDAALIGERLLKQIDESKTKNKLAECL